MVLTDKSGTHTSRPRRQKTLAEQLGTLHTHAINYGVHQPGIVENDDKIVVLETEGWKIEIRTSAAKGGSMVVAGFPKISFHKGQTSVYIAFPTMYPDDADIKRGSRRIEVRGGSIISDSSRDPQDQPLEDLLSNLTPRIPIRV